MFNDVVAYLKQLRDVYGNEVWTEPLVNAVGDVFTLPQSTIETKPPEQVVTAINWADTTSLESLHEAICDCMLCPLGTTRTKFVFGSGNPNADVMVLGEAPGADEDQQGLPFVGRAGQLLTKILESVQLDRSDVFICNILKCRPPNNRKPTTAETDSCEPYLWKQIELIKPRFILALGLTAANTLLKNKDSMSQLRGKIHDYHGIQTIVTYHPAALLRNPNWKRETWEDVKYLRSLIDNQPS